MRMPIHDRKPIVEQAHPLVGVSILGVIALIGYLSMTVNVQRNCVFDADTIQQAKLCVN